MTKPRKILSTGTNNYGFGGVWCLINVVDMKVLVGFLAIVFAVIGNASAKQYLLHGSISGRYVTMSLNTDMNFASGDDVSVHYFDTVTFVDVSLYGKRTKEGGILVHGIHDNAYNGNRDTTEILDLASNESGVWSGKCVDRYGAESTVSFYPIATSFVKSKYDYLPLIKSFAQNKNEDDKYNYLKSARISIVNDSVVKKGSLKLQFFHLLNSKVYSFRIVKGVDKIVAEKANRIIMDKFMENVLYHCTHYCGDTQQYIYRIDDLFITKNVLSADIEHEYYSCKDRYPELWNTSLNIDIKKGARLYLSDVLFLADNKSIKPNTKDENDFYYDTYGPELYKLIMKLHRDNMLMSANWLEQWKWLRPNWCITKKGIHILPTHVAIPDYKNPDWSVIPFNEVEKYKNPNKNISLP